MVFQGLHDNNRFYLTFTIGTILPKSVLSQSESACCRLNDFQEIIESRSAADWNDIGVVVLEHSDAVKYSSWSITEESLSKWTCKCMSVSIVSSFWVVPTAEVSLPGSDIVFSSDIPD
uniref:Uncharacterized protein n=1 Tax=Cacopsylla melanoneura TaxID=428564 RepID=A0A8D8WH85_9HEMI